MCPQMREKLELMRQKKQEYLQYQRQLALQRMQEQEREMLLRQEHAKHQYMMQQQQQQQLQFHPAMYGVMPGVTPPQMMPNPYQPHLPPVSGQFQPIPTSSISYMPQPGLSQGCYSTFLLM